VLSITHGSSLRDAYVRLSTILSGLLSVEAKRPFSIATHLWFPVLSRLWYASWRTRLSLLSSRPFHFTSFRMRQVLSKVVIADPTYCSVQTRWLLLNIIEYPPLAKWSISKLSGNFQWQPVPFHSKRDVLFNCTGCEFMTGFATQLGFTV
jgi:hypothetical protein